MSHYNELEVDCPQCTESFTASVWTAVNAGQDPELKDLLLGGELNILSCDRCGHQFFYENFLIYREPKEELIVYVYPEFQKDEEAQLRELMLAGFREAVSGTAAKETIHYEPVLIFGLASLAEMLREETERLDESRVAEAICRQNGIETIALPPAKARTADYPTTLPIAKTGQNDRQRILTGLTELLTINPTLGRYVSLKDAIASQSDWKLPSTAHG